MRVFLDSSVIISAALSSKGGSFRVIAEASFRSISLLTSRYVLYEAERNIQDIRPEFLNNLITLAPALLLVNDPPPEKVRHLSRYIHKKDAPVLGAALAARADVLLTLDRRDFINNKSVKKAFSFLEVTTPGDFIQKYFV